MKRCGGLNPDHESNVLLAGTTNERGRQNAPVIQSHPDEKHHPEGYFSKLLQTPYQH